MTASASGAVAPALLISVVVPVYNNQGSLRELCTRISAAVQPHRYEIVCVNDGSRDDSLGVLRELAAEDPCVRVISLSRNFGQHPAISAGFAHARGSHVVLMDADLQDAPEDIPRLLASLQQAQAEVAYTVRVGHERGGGSRLTSRLYHYVFSRIVKTDLPQNIGTLRLFTRRVLDAVNAYPEHAAVYGPLMLFIGFKRTFVEVDHHARPHGKSGYSFYRRLALAANSLISYTSVPHTASMFVGIGITLCSLLYALVLLIQYALLGRALPPGLTLVVLLLALMLGSLMTTLGIIGSYVFRVYQEVLRRPRYHVEETINV